MVFSHSRLSAYENCPRMYAFRYIEKPPIEERQSIEAFMGSTVHDVLEKLYQAVQMERTPKWEKVRDAYDAYWDKNFNDSIFIVRREYSAQDYRNVGRRCLQDYFVKHYPFRESRTLGLEERITVDLDGSGEYRLQGFIDRLAECDDGTIEIHDYKTSRRLPSQEEVDKERQLALYQLGIEDRWEDVRSVRLIWHYLRSGRTMTSVRSPESLDVLRQETMRLIDTVQGATDRGVLPPNESALCDWCDYQELCPAKKHLFATATMTPAEFSADDGVRLADRFAAASREKKEAEAALLEVRQEVIQFAKATNTTRLVGHNLTVGVSRRIEQTVPRANTSDRARLESLVRASGQWEKVSDLSRSKLPKALQGNLFNKETRSEIESLLSKSEVITVSQRRLSSEDTDDGPDV
jgi:putative RecB family exonuclease